MTAPPFPSQPIDQPLAWDAGGRTHLLAADETGGATLLRLLAARPATVVPATLAIRLTGDAARGASIVATGGGGLRSHPTDHDLLAALPADFAAARMGLRLYLAGSGWFVDRACAIAAGFGLGADAIRAERVGPPERAVYCVHCKTITPRVRTNLVACTGCDRMLMVREHHSRRLAAYMGFQVDAEAPGERPPVEGLRA